MIVVHAKGTDIPSHAYVGHNCIGHNYLGTDIEHSGLYVCAYMLHSSMSESASAALLHYTEKRGAIELPSITRWPWAWP